MALAVAIAVGLVTRSANPSPTDLVSLLFVAIVYAVSAGTSPWRKVASLPQMRELNLHHSGVDLSTPRAMAAGLATGAVAFGIAAAADATGFGVFMASASALGAMGASFGTIQTSMCVLGVLLTPWVYITLSLAAGCAVVLSMLKTGDSLLDEATASIRRREWDNAYSAARQASERWILRPSQEKISEWEEWVSHEQEKRTTQLGRLERICWQIAEKPFFRWWVCYMVVGTGVGTGLGILAIRSGGSAISVFLAQVGLGIPFADWCLAAAFAEVVTQTPIIHAEIAALRQIAALRMR